MTSKLIFCLLFFLNLRVLSMELGALEKDVERSLIGSPISEISTPVKIANRADYDVIVKIKVKNNPADECVSTIESKNTKILADAKDLDNIISIAIEMVKGLTSWLSPVKSIILERRELSERFWHIKSNCDIFLHVTVSPDKENLQENVFDLSYPVIDQTSDQTTSKEEES